MPVVFLKEIILGNTGQTFSNRYVNVIEKNKNVVKNVDLEPN